VTRVVLPESTKKLEGRAQGPIRKQSRPEHAIAAGENFDLPRSKGYRDLLVWQRPIEMVESVYGLTAEFPASERFGLVAQMRRAAISVPSNVAEGYGRQSTGEFRQFLGVARGSNCELETQLILSRRLGFGSEEKLSNAERLNAEVSRLLHGYMKSLHGGSG